MKFFAHILLFVALLLPAESLLSHPGNPGDTAAGSEEVIVLNKADFLEKVYNYEKNPEEWVYEGTLPCIIDFYADWCPPCKKVAPILKELAAEYKGKILVYQINVESERELARFFGVSSIPMFLFVPAKNRPQSAMGAMPRDSFVEVIEKFLLKDSE